ncbi:DUF2066 domain-containing protein [Kordiimonas aquimaris]|uniref:DUF2066 domain-containing protein n=1 Tax=Kordiimonas aquimaris TaxID=707591 RepID=UPI0021CEB8FA|nr:DUF2066 domain-containing protein [Kordiimonas aquimaris]
MSNLFKNMAFFFRVFRMFVAVLIFLPIGIQGLWAQTDTTLDQLFTIREVRVDEIARSANQARQAALLKAEEDAYTRLIRKITQAEHRDRLPVLGTAERQALISGIELVDELSSNRRYVATLNVRFAPSRVSEFLAEYNVPHVLGTGNDILVLHAHKRGLTEILWKQDQVIDAARDEVDWLNRIRGYRFARGEISERMSISAHAVDAFDTEAAINTSKISGLESVLLISSNIGLSVAGEKQLFYRFIATDSGVSAEGAVPIADDQASSELTGEAAALALMYEQVLEAIDGAWRERLLVDTGSQDIIDVFVATLSLDEMAQIELKLSEISLVQNYKIIEIGLPTSRFAISYTGRLDQLILAMQFAGLELKPYGSQMILEHR